MGITKNTRATEKTRGIGERQRQRGRRVRGSPELTRRRIERVPREAKKTTAGRTRRRNYNVRANFLAAYSTRARAHVLTYVVCSWCSRRNYLTRGISIRRAAPALITFSNLPPVGLRQPSRKNCRRKYEEADPSACALNQIYARIWSIDSRSLSGCSIIVCSRMSGCGRQISRLQSHRSDVIMCLSSRRFSLPFLIFLYYPVLLLL